MNARLQAARVRECARDTVVLSQGAGKRPIIVRVLSLLMGLGLAGGVLLGLPSAFADSAVAVTVVSPNYGPTAGGTVVTITGYGFTGATSVEFGEVGAASYTVDSDTQITATSPAYVAGTVDVEVTTPAGVSPDQNDDFTYQPSLTETFLISQLTHNDYLDLDPHVSSRVSGDRVVWYGYSNNDYNPEVFTWVAGDSEPTRLTQNNYPDYSPRVSGDRVVWYGFDGNDYEIYTWTPADGTVALTDNSYDDLNAEISGDRVVWEGNVDGVSHIFTWAAGDSSPTQLTSGTRADFVPQVSGDRVVWQSSNEDGTETAIYTWVVGDTSPTLISGSTQSNFAPQVSGNRVVWENHDGDVNGIFTWTPTEGTTELTDDNLYVSNAHVSNDLVVWRGYDDGRSTFQTFVWTPTHGTIEVSAITGDTDDGYPQVSGDRVAWEGHDGNDWEIFTYTPATGTANITDDSMDERAAQVSGDRVVWFSEGASNADYEIYSAIPAPSLMPPTALAVTDYAGDNGEALNLSWQASGGATGYRLYRGTQSGVYGYETDLGDLTSYVDTGLTAGQTYYYALRSYNAGGDQSELCSEVDCAPVDNNTETDVAWVPAGSDVPAEAAGVSIAFAHVTSPGTITVTPTTPTGVPPSSFRLLDTGWLVEVGTLVFDGTATITFSYDPAALPPGVQEADLTILHSEGGVWQDVTVPQVDTANNRITARVTSFSPFALAAPANRAPVIAGITAAPALVRLGTAVAFTGSFTDADHGDAHTATWQWDRADPTTVPGTVTEISPTTGSVADTHTYSTGGVYEVTLRVTDAAGAAAQLGYQYVVVYDPNGSFVTGGGWIMSPAGAYAANPALTGKANFGFNSKYHHGASVPTGNTEFHFKAGNLDFSSHSYLWLVVTGAKAMYKGTGTINGAGDYGLLISIIDGDLQHHGAPDTFRIKIWNKATGQTVYDNQMGAPEDADASTVIGGGSIVIHR